MSEQNTNNAELNGTQNQNPNAEGGNPNETEKTYTQEEVDALLQQEGDRRISMYQKKMEKQTAEKLAEAQKLAKMNEEQKYIYELEQREKAITEKENALALAENKNICAKILAEKGIPVDFVDFVVTSPDADVMNNNINIIDRAFKKAVKAEVEKRLASNAPKKALDGLGMTKEQFSKLDYTQLVKLKNENPELYEQFIR